MERFLPRERVAVKYIINLKWAIASKKCNVLVRTVLKCNSQDYYKVARGSNLIVEMENSKETSIILNIPI